MTKAKIYIVGTVDPLKDWWFCFREPSLTSCGLDLDHGYTLDELRAIHKRYGPRTVFRPPVAIDDIQTGPQTHEEKMLEFNRVLQAAGMDYEPVDISELLKRSL